MKHEFTRLMKGRAFDHRCSSLYTNCDQLVGFTESKFPEEHSADQMKYMKNYKCFFPLNVSHYHWNSLGNYYDGYAVMLRLRCNPCKKSPLLGTPHQLALKRGT